MVKRKSNGDGDSPVASKKLKHYDLGSDGILNLTVAITGAIKGDVLEGVVRTEGNSSNDSRGVLLEVADGRVFASSSVCKPIPRNDIVAAYAKRYGLSTEMAENRVSDRKMDNPDSDNAHPMGSSCPSIKGEHGVYSNCNCEIFARFKILDPGCWVDIADQFGNKEKLLNYVSKGEVLSWRQILALFGNKSLMLRPRLYRVVMGPRIISQPDPSKLISCAKKDFERVIYEFPESNLQVDVNVSAGGPPNASAVNLVKEALECDDSILNWVYENMKMLSNGALKSAMQKAVRYGAPNVNVNGKFVSSHMYAAMACAILALNPGGFVPQLQKLVRGIVSALKRTAVIAVEDACCGSVSKIKRLLGIAYVCQCVKDYYPMKNIYVECIQVIAECAQSDFAIDYDNKSKSLHSMKSDESKAKSLLQSAILLKNLGSFAGDIKMFDSVANLAKSGSIPIVKWETRPPVMQEYHIIDQHTQPGIGHVMSMGNASFEDRFKSLFKGLTGFNPRRRVFTGMIKIKEICQPAQEIVFNLVTKRLPRKQIPIISKKGIVVNGRVSRGSGYKYCVDYGTLASAIGPIEESVKCMGRKKKDLLVVLSTVPGGKESVMLKPSRAKVDDYMEWSGAEKEKELAIRQARSRVYNVKSPLLPNGYKASFNSELGEWMFGSTDQAERTWKSFVEEKGFNHPYDVLAEPKWPKDDSFDYRDQRLLQDALSWEGNGACERAYDWVDLLCKSAGFDVVSRAQSLLHQRFSSFSMPVPARDGNIAMDQLQAYDGDWDVWRFLVLLSRIYPGALKADVPPRFVVQDPIVLYVMSNRLQRKRMEFAVIADKNENKWRSNDDWKAGLEACKDILRPHQRDAVIRLKERDHKGVKGHYLVMDTGYGKTYTAISYAMSLLIEDNFGCNVDYIVWVTPPGDKIDKKGKSDDPKNFQLIKSLMAEFIEVEGALLPLPIHFVDKNSKVMKKYHINVVNHDHMRLMPKMLIANAPRSFVIFDEGDKLYNASKRTSMAFQIADSCPKFIIQTATPVPTGKIDLMAQWLSRTEQFPVDKSNYLVAACNMVQLKIMLPFTVGYESFVIKHSDEATRACNEYIKDQSWFKFFNKIQKLTDPSFCERAYYYAKKDRAVYKNGGCFVVCENADHVSRMINLFNSKYSDIRCGDSLAMGDSSVGVVFVAARNDRGYNQGVRFGAQIRQPYPGSASSRHQMEGRLKRALTQKRPHIVFEVVYMERSLTELLYKRQQRDDNVNLSLEGLAKEYLSTVLQ